MQISCDMKLVFVYRVWVHCSLPQNLYLVKKHAVWVRRARARHSWQLYQNICQNIIICKVVFIYFFAFLVQYNKAMQNNTDVFLFFPDKLICMENPTQESEIWLDWYTATAKT